MIELPIEVGALGWASTLVFWLVGVIIVVGLVRALIKNNKKL